MKSTRRYMPLLLASIFFLTLYPDVKGFYPYQAKPEQQEPALKPPKAAAKPKPPEIKKPKLLKSLLGYLQFKKNADKKLNSKIISAVEQLGLKDTIAATTGNIQTMIAELKKEKNQDLDSVQAILHMLLQKQSRTDTTAGVTAREEAATPPTPFELETLASQLIPIINKKNEEEQTDKNKAGKLKLINRIRNAEPGTVYKLKESDSVSKSFTLTLKNKTDVYSFYDCTIPFNHPDNFFTPSTSLVYYALAVNEATGEFDNLNGWDTSAVVETAHKAGASIFLCILVPNKTGLSSLLYKQDLKEKCISNMLKLLKERSASGIDISFKNLSKKDREPFAEFIKLAYKTLQSQGYKLFVTVPRIDLAEAYHVEVLNLYTDKFFLDFATNTSTLCGPLAPLQGGSQQTIDASFSWYSAHGIEAQKIAIILPYRGTRWLLNPSANTSQFVDYASFSDIRKNYNSPEIYDEESESVYIDTSYSDNRTFRIWFDNDATLENKYRYILDNDIGGVGLYFVNYDDAYYELSDELACVFTSIDTTYISTPAVSAGADLSLFQKLTRYLSLYNYILQHPCSTCFEDSTLDADEKKLFHSYLKDLQLDSLMHKNGTIHAEFDFINRQFNRILLCCTLFFLFISSGVVIFYVYGNRYYGGDWQYRKLTAGICVILLSLFVLIGFTYCFTSDLIPVFGISSASASNTNCVIDPTCINIPFNTLLLVIFISMILGLLIFRYLIIPLLKREHVP